MTNEERLRQLDDNEHHAREVLRKLDYPSSALDRVWWAMSFATRTRDAWRSGALRALDQIEEERARLR